MKITEGLSKPFVGYTGEAPRGGSSGKPAPVTHIRVNEVKITWRAAAVMFTMSLASSMLAGLFWFLVIGWFVK